MTRGRPRKIIQTQPILVEEIPEIPEVPKVVDNRIPRNKVPIKYNEDLVRDIKDWSLIYPKETEMIINKSLLVIEWFVGVMDGLDNSGMFSDEGGWKKKFDIVPPRVKL